MSIVTGKTVNDILNIDSKTFNSLNLSDLRLLTGRLVSAGNKRLRSFAKSGIETPATQYVARSGGKFSTRGKNLNALRSEFMRAKKFFESETGSKRGYKKVINKTVKGLAKQGIYVDEDQLPDMFNIYERLKEIDPSIEGKNMKYRVLEVIVDELVDDYDTDDIYSRLSESLNEIYEQGYDSEYDISDFFEI